MNRKKVYIACSAIWFNDGKERAHLPRNIRTGIVACGLRHCNCFTILHAIFPDKEYLDGEDSIQGFLTSEGDFVTRQIAGTIAIAAGQIEKMEYFGGNELDSSDLY